MVPQKFLDERVRHFRDILDTAGSVGAIISRPEHVYYFTGFIAEHFPTFLIISENDLCVIHPDNQKEISPLYKDVSYQAFSLFQTANLDDNICSAIQEGLSSLGLTGKTVALESRHLCQKYAAGIEELVRIVGDVGLLIEKIRYCKDDYEIDTLRQIQTVFRDVFLTACHWIQPGMSEIELFSLIYSRIANQIQAPFIWQGCLGGGVRSALDNPQPSSYVFRKGDIVLLDIFSRVRQYYGDMTRTFLIGKPSPRHIDVYRVLEDALYAGVDIMRPGVRACEIDRTVRGIISKAGLDTCFPHHSGHGIGLWQQESPYLIPSNASVLQEYCVIALEPGIYLPGFGGMRLENLYLITENGAEPIVEMTNSLFQIEM